jgi:hypothetical protein
MKSLSLAASVQGLPLGCLQWLACMIYAGAGKQMNTCKAWFWIAWSGGL